MSKLNNGTISCRHLYPKDGDECRKVICNMEDETAYKYIFTSMYAVTCFEELIKNRLAYWTIANNWRPFWKDPYQERWSIICDSQGNLQKAHNVKKPTIFVFPTKEMRDAFYENFNELLNKCKEFVV